MALSGWDSSKKIKIAIDSTKVDADLTNYTFKVEISTTSGKTNENLATKIFTELGSSQFKIAFEIGDSGVETYAEIEYWSSSNNLAIIWVLVPSVSSSVDTFLNMYYLASHADNTTYIKQLGSASAVWPTQILVCHCADENCNDSSQHNANATKVGIDASNVVNGQHGKALNLDSGDSIRFTSTTPHPTNKTFSISYGIKPDTVLNYNQSLNDVGGWNYFASHTDANGGLYIGTDITNRITPTQSGNNFYVSGVYCEVSFTYDGTQGRLYKNGILTAGPKTMNQPLAWTSFGPVTNYDGIIEELRVSQGVYSAAWIKADYYSSIDDFVTYSSKFYSSLIKLYGAGEAGPKDLIQVWGLMHDPATINIIKLWHIFLGPVYQSLIQLFGMVVENVLNKPYSDAAVSIISIVKRFGDSPYPQTSISMKYSDALSLEMALQKIYNIMFSANSELTKPFAITESEIKTAIEQLYELAVYSETIRVGLSKIYGIVGNYSNITNFNNLSVIASGVVVYPDDITINEELNQYCITAEMIFKNQADYAVIPKNGSITFNNGTTTYDFFVSEKRRSRTRNGVNGISNEYIISCLSFSASLDHPYSLPISKSWDNAELASVITQELAGDINIDWQINDWTIPAGTLFANNETPIQVIRKIIRERGIVQDNPTGNTISIVKEYSISPPKWSYSAVDHTLSDLDDIETLSEYEDERSGTNKIIVSNQLTSNKLLDPVEEKIDGTTKIIKGYRVPWVPTFILQHSGGSWISIVDNGIVLENITDEFVEFVDGIGRTRQPIYSQPTVKWMETGLGGLTYGEDGVLKSEIVGNSLAEVTYYTQYRSWTIKDNKNEKVQVWLKETEND